MATGNMHGKFGEVLEIIMLVDRHTELQTHTDGRTDRLYMLIAIFRSLPAAVTKRASDPFY